MDFDISFPFDVGRSHRITLEPCWINLSTVAFPRPDAPPVTRETAPYITIINKKFLQYRKETNKHSNKFIIAFIHSQPLALFTICY